MANNSELRPGTNLKVIVETDIIRETSDVRSSVVYDVHDRGIIIAQLDPPISQSSLNRTLAVTYLVREENEAVRYGFEAKVTEIVKDYPLSSSARVRALLLTVDQKVRKYNLRMHFRVEPLSTSDLGLSIYGKKVNIIDISVGGVKISHVRARKFEIHETIRLVLTTGGKDHELFGKVLRIWEHDHFERNPLQFVSIQFVFSDANVRSLLGRIVTDLQREINYIEKSREL